MNFDDVKDIFLTIQDFGLMFHNINLINALSMGDKNIIKDPKYLQKTQTDPRKPYNGIKISLEIRREPTKNTEFNFGDDFYEELEFAINHFENRNKCLLSNIYIHKNNGVWLKNVDVMSSYIKTLSKESISWMSSIDLTFEVKK